jgi:hypothetical protein
VSSQAFLTGFLFPLSTLWTAPVLISFVKRAVFLAFLSQTIFAG